MLAGRIGDGLIATAPNKEVLQTFDRSGGAGRRGSRPTLGQVTVCWAADEASARRTAREWWPTAAIRGDSSQELALPSSFEALAAGVTEDQVAEAIACGPDPAVHLETLQPYLEAGFDHVYLHQVGPTRRDFQVRRAGSSHGSTAPEDTEASGMTERTEPPERNRRRRGAKDRGWHRRWDRRRHGLSGPLGAVAGGLMGATIGAATEDDPQAGDDDAPEGDPEPADPRV